MPDERAFARLLHWYPRRWRESNGDVFLATVLAEARERGSREPDARLRASSMLHGIGMRLNGWTVGICLILIVGSVWGWSLMTFSPVRDGSGQGPWEWVDVALRGLVLPGAIVVAGAATLRERGLLGPVRACGALAAGGAAVVANAVAQGLWVWGPLVGAEAPVLADPMAWTLRTIAWGLFAVIGAAVADESSRPRFASRAVGWAVGAGVGWSLGGMIVFTSEFPPLGLLCAAVIAVGLLLRRSRSRVARRGEPLTGRVRGAVTVLALTALLMMVGANALLLPGAGDLLAPVLGMRADELSMWALVPCSSRRGSWRRPSPADPGWGSGRCSSSFSSRGSPSSCRCRPCPGLGRLSRRSANPSGGSTTGVLSSSRRRRGSACRG
ncbi:hypothetical protein M3T53_05885 [Actinomyces sp. B33]|uniref:hypothetical protein n=1 Tax=Actinomyces sp. B33 TaxID=2942131 RepID=UPI002340A2DC|nr:hypothetical protein [Actinomyces sp. B33]MDC4233240.1 hypothetical protein [Actinomyces sp. B33]